MTDPHNATYAVVASARSCVLSCFAMRGKDYSPRPFFIATFALISLESLGTFPIFFDRRTCYPILSSSLV